MKLLHKNTLSGVGQLVLTAGLTFFSIPLFIKTLGAEAYGAFSIVTLAGNLNIFANLGLNTALLKFLSTQGKSKDSDQDIVVTFGLLVLIMVPISLLAISQQRFILQELLGLSDALYIKVASLYKCVVLANLILLLGQTGTTMLDSQKRMYQTNFYQLIYSVLYWGGLIIVVNLGYDMIAVGYVILMAALIWFVLVTAAALRMWGVFEFENLDINIIRIVRKQITFSSNVYAAGLLSMLFEPLTKILVARLIGVKEVGYLEIAYKIRSQLWSLVTKITYPIYPEIAQEINTFRLKDLIVGYQKKMLLIIVPSLLFFTLALSDLLSIWLPETNEIIAIATLSISSSYLVGTLAIPIYYFLMSRDQSKKTVWLQLCNVIVNSAVVYATHQFWGFYSVIIANCLAIMSSLCLSMYFQKKYDLQPNINWAIKIPSLIIFFVIVSFSIFTNHLIGKPVLRVAFAVIYALILHIVLSRKTSDIVKIGLSKIN